MSVQRPNAKKAPELLNQMRETSADLDHASVQTEAGPLRDAAQQILALIGCRSTTSSERHRGNQRAGVPARQRASFVPRVTKRHRVPAAAHRSSSVRISDVVLDGLSVPRYEPWMVPEVSPSWWVYPPLI